MAEKSLNQQVHMDLMAGIEAHKAGRYQQAEAIYRSILTKYKPEHPDALHLLGVLAHQSGRHEMALQLIDRALAMHPNSWEYHGNRGLVLSQLGRHKEAIVASRRALEIKPDFPEAHNNLGAALSQLGMFEEAAESLQTALKYNPDYAEVLNNLGNAYYNQGKTEEAIKSYTRAAELKPTMAEAHNNLGNGYLQKKEYDKAIECYHQSLKMKPTFATAYNNMGNALKEKGELMEAAAAYEKAISLRPRYAEGSNNLANIKKDLGLMTEALAWYRKSVEYNPSFAAADSNYVYCLQFHPDYDAPTILAETRKWNERHARALTAAAPPHHNDRDPDRKLRIGYVSPDFRDHVIARNLLPLFERHDKKRFEIFCYAQVVRTDEFSDRFKAASDEWRQIVGINNEKAEKMIRDDKIDILVDLSLHLAANRLLILARKPAPVQVTFGGYPGTTGMDAIDYRLTDPYLDPPGQNDQFYSEQSFRLPDSFWCYEQSAMQCPEDPPNPLPALTNGYITFGCLNNFCKVNDQVMELWARVMKRVENSRLVLLVPRSPARDRMQQKLSREGIDASRLEFVDRVSRSEYLRVYERIDLGLDTFPYNGHTTSLDSIWMGVPVVTLVGKTVAGRAGWSQLSNLKLTELAANTPEQFIDIATNLAAATPRLSELRQTLRQRMRSSPICEADRFTRAIESAYRQMWQKWCNQ